MVLIITSTRDTTADYLVGKLKSAGVNFFRFDTDLGIDRLDVKFDVKGPVLSIDGIELKASAVDLIWFRRPTPLSGSDVFQDAESKWILEEWSAAVEGFLSHVPLERWMNHPAINQRSGNKMEQITRARAFGLEVPETIVSRNAEEVRRFWEICRGNMVVKPLSAGLVEADDETQSWHIYTNQVSGETLKELSDLKGCPTLFQKMVLKSSDVRVTWIDGKFFPVQIKREGPDGRQIVDIRRDNMDGVKYSNISMPVNVERYLERLITSYGLRFAAIDFAISEEGLWNFLEINPNGQWAWMDLAGISDLAGRFVSVFEEVTCSAGSNRA